MMAGTNEHGWVLARLHAHAAGLLDERDEVRLLAHLDRCDACRTEAAEDLPLNAEDLDDARHLPPSLIARWNSSSLDGFEREMVTAHLARCENCRRDLAALGHEPELVEAASGTPGNGMAHARSPEGTGPARRMSAPSRTRGPRWIPWAMGGWAIAASLVAVALALRSPGTDATGTMSPLETGKGPAPAGTSDRVAAGEGASFTRSGRVVRLTSPERGAQGDGVTTITLGLDETALRFVIEPLIDVPPDAMVRIQLLAASGARHAEIRVRHREAVHPDRGVLFQIEPRLFDETEPLTLLASAVPAPGAAVSEPETASYRIRFVRED